MPDSICLMEEEQDEKKNVFARSFNKTDRLGGRVKTLTPRQQEILQLLARGFYYKEIGAALGISHSTVRAHLHSVYRKLEVNSRARAVIKFHEQRQLS